MRTFLLSALLLTGLAGWPISPARAQTQPQPHPSAAVLTPFQVQLLDSLLSQQRGAFTFQAKRVAFFSGTRGNTAEEVNTFFRRYVLPSRHAGHVSGLSCHLFSAEEKAQASNYDAVVFFAVKIRPSQQQVINQTRKYATRSIPKTHRV